MGRRVGLLTLCAGALSLLAPAARAQSAGITVAPIPVTVAGDTLQVRWTVTNTGGGSRSFGVGAEIRRDAAVLADLGGQTTPVLAPGATAAGTFAFALPTWWCGGTCVARAAAWTGSAGSSTWLAGFDRAFDVEQVVPATAGRVVYHAYSDYLALPVEADDGHVLVRTLPAGPRRRLTDGLPVENAVNPHLSPDGSRVTFTAIPRGVVSQGTPRTYASLGRYLELFVYDLARDSLARLTVNDVADEDGRFSPDGRHIVLKRAGQVWVMDADGGDAVPLTASGAVKSGPGYSPDGAWIVYWDGDGPQADIWRMSSSGGAAALLVGSGGLQEYYPVYRDAQTVLYCRWESSSDRHDKLYAHSLATGASQRLPFNLAGVEDADPFPVDAGLIGFSSTRRGGSYDLYVGDPATGAAYPVDTPNDALQELGGEYSRYTEARALALVSPGTAVQRMAGDPMVVSVRAWEDGGAWAGAAPRVVLEGPTAAEFAGLHDDGVGADAVAGDGIYSAAVTLPSQAGSYQAHAAAISDGNGLTHELRSTAVPVSLIEQLPVPVAGGPALFRLEQNHPNPFGPLTSIEFAIPRAAETRLGIYDVRGVQVATLIERELPAGRYRAQWDGSRVPSGVYFCRLQSGGSSQTRKLLLRR